MSHGIILPSHEAAPRECDRRGHGSRNDPLNESQFTRGKGCNNRKLSDVDRAEIVRLYTTPLPDGTWMGVTTIATQFGVTHNCIQDRLRRAGVEMRSAREAHRGKRCKPITNVPHDLPMDCKCGCGETTAWNQRKNRWNTYIEGHRGGRHLDAAWLRTEYVGRRRTFAEIAADCGVTASSVRTAAHRLGIPVRDRSESRLGRHVGQANAAWKGGVAQWTYASDWKAIARQIRDRDAWTCQDCDERRSHWGHALHVHHIDEDKLNNDPRNLVSLCAGCHRNRHRKGGGA